MEKIAVIAGGFSGEYVISMKSVQTVIRNIDTELFAPYLILITKEKWVCLFEENEYPIDKNDFSCTIHNEKITFDLAFIVIHGTPGEDGKLQGYLDIIGIPYTTCNAILSAVTFNKSYCNKVVKDFGIVKVANSVHLFKHTSYSLGSILEELKLPVFVKPNEAGSSIGVSKVTDAMHLSDAIDKAFEEDGEVLIEEFIEGRELTIGAYRNDGNIIVLPPTEIISKNSFFDFEAKYTPGITNEVTPAEIPDDLLDQLRYKTEVIYKKLGCEGIVRIDYIWEKSTKELFFLEINTMPGQSEQSLIPQQVKANGMELKEFYTIIIKEALR